MQAQLILVVIIGLICLPYLLSIALCPKVCVPCFEHVMSCSSGGLHEIPTDMHMDTKKVIFIGHSFLQSSLTRQNFSTFSKPKYSIEQLSIRRSNIQLIQSQAFYDLSGLDTLDLSDNAKLTVEERAFANLKLKYLRLDQIGSLTLALTAFDGLLVASLSIKNSHLQTFPYSLLEPLSKDLRKLFLSKNKIRTLSPKFEALFRQLTVLDLHDNPLICSCGLLWLSITLRWRQQHFSTPSDSLSAVQSPTCSAPSYLLDEYIDRVPDSEFNCYPPKLDRIEIQFQNLNKVILRCAAVMAAKRAPMNISWIYIDEHGYVYPPIITSADQHVAAIAFDRHNAMDKFVCAMSSETGNVSVQVHINWPTNRLIKTALNYTLHRHAFNPNISKQPPKYHQHFFFREQYSLLELLASVIGTFFVTLVIFVVIYRFYFYKAIKLKKEQLKKCGYVTYEVGMYSDSQTYDIPQYPSFEPRQKLCNPIFSVPHPNQPRIDYTTISNHKL